MSFTIAELQLVLTSVTALAAIVSPVVSVAITSRSQKKIKQLEFHEQQTSTLYSSFTAAYAAWKVFPGKYEETREFTAAIHELAIYARDEDVSEVLLSLGERVANAKTENYSDGTRYCADEKEISSLYTDILRRLAKSLR